MIFALWKKLKNVLIFGCDQYHLEFMSIVISAAVISIFISFIKKKKTKPNN